jgi:hypothetical protein
MFSSIEMINVFFFLFYPGPMVNYLGWIYDFKPTFQLLNFFHA